MGFAHRLKTVVRGGKDFARGAYAKAHEWAPHVQKFAAGAKRAYGAASPMIDEYGGRHAANIHGAARRGFDTYDSLERAAMQGEAVMRAARG
jgi:hypothetical protein